MSLPNEKKVELLRRMMRIRCAEEILARLYKEEQEMRTPTHFSIGQEAVAVGVCAALEQEDVIFSGHRCHAHYLAKGGDLLGMVGELYGKEIGCAKGRGGSVHLRDTKAGVVASSAILGETLAVAVGAAFALKLEGSRQVAAAFFGDGMTEEGIFHESLNFASLHKLPVLLICENNLYSTHSPLSVRQVPGIEIYERASIYQIPSQKIFGNDVMAVYETISSVLPKMRSGEGPHFFEFMTYRWREHVGPLWDYDWGYRTKEEVDSWIERCPIKRAAAHCMEAGICTEKEISAWSREFEEEVMETIVTAKKSPFPSVESIFDHTY